MILAPYYLSAFMLHLFGKTFNWSYCFVIVGLSFYMTYSYLTLSANKIWKEQIIKD